MESKNLIGQSQTHLITLNDGNQLHIDVEDSFTKLQKAAEKAGFSLQIASAFRSFEKQLKIWNDKAQAIRPVLDDHSQPIDILSLTESERIRAILRFSALPGASRHHWGTDFDYYDAAAVNPDYRLQLVPDEYGETGVFGGLAAWLDENMDRFGFFRPYASDRGGVHPERWHLSHTATATQCAQKLSVDLIRSALSTAAITYHSTLLNEIEELYKKFIINIDMPKSIG